jgi:hypothetical protein
MTSTNQPEAIQYDGPEDDTLHDYQPGAMNPVILRTVCALGGFLCGAVAIGLGVAELDRQLCAIYSPGRANVHLADPGARAAILGLMLVAGTRELYHRLA